MEGRYVEQLADGRLRCRLCPHHCRLAPGETGRCQVRRNVDGRLLVENYGKISSAALDPVEKKPLYHFHPGGYLLSFGSFGCNFTCEFCQNWSISQFRPPTRDLSPEAAVELLRATAAEEPRTVGVAYTYAEPSVWYEYVYDTSVLVRKAGFANVLVSNGYLERRPLLDLLPLIDAANIDLKAMNPRYYQRICHGSLKKVEESIAVIAASGTHLEVTTLVVPGQNDSPEEMERLARFLAGLNPDIPLHLSRFFPNYRMGGEPTPVATLTELRNIARRHLHYVYLGNLPESMATYCRRCGALLLDRFGYEISPGEIEGDRCRRCGEKLPFVGTVHLPPNGV